jgi:hypothetical protein
MTEQTSQPLTEEQLAAIEARLNAATPGSWHLTDADTVVAPLTSVTIADVWEPTAATRNGEFIETAPTDVRALLDEIARLKGQRRYLIGQIAKKDAKSGDADRAVTAFLTGGEQPEPEPAATPLTDDRNPAGNREPMLWNDSAGNLLSIFPDCVDDEDRPTVGVEIREPIFNGFFNVPQAEVPRLAADLCAAAGFRELSEQLLAGEQPAAEGAQR